MRIESLRPLLRQEIRVVGAWLFALPAFVAGVFAIALGMMVLRHAQHSDVSNMALAGIEGTVPLVAGIAVATIASVEPALELQLAVMRSYRRTVLRRIVLLLAWCCLLEVLSVVLLAHIWSWALTRDDLPGYVLTWFAPLLWFSAWGAILALLLRSRGASVTILAVVWTIELLLHGALAGAGWMDAVNVFATMFEPWAPYWGTNRIALILTALAVFYLLWLYLGNSELRLLGEEG